MNDIILSTVILNWNRAHLLEQTLTSYMDTVTCPHELWIIDNASTDNSREVIERFLREHPQTQILFLKHNRGGEAINEVIPKLKGKLVYIAENDQIHLPGWCEKAIHAFNSYPRLGQFSLHAPVPTDAEAWVTKPVTPRFKNACLVYQLHTNVTTSCIIRAVLFEQGLRIHNIPNPGSDILLPNDGRLSGDVKKLNFWVAYSDQYYVRNIGHEAEEIEKHPEYYKSNYQAKKHVGVEELARRLQLQKQLSRVRRQSLLFPEEPVLGELAQSGVDDLEPRFWSMFDSRTPEVEVVEFIHSLVRLLKPRHVLETGGWIGYVTAAISFALTRNGMGHLTTVENGKGPHEYLSRQLAILGFSNVTLLNEHSERVTPKEPLDFVIFNSGYEDQEEEFYHLLPYLKEGATLVFTNNARHDAHPIESNPVTYQRLGLVKGQHYPTPRGVYVGTYQPFKPPASRRMIFGLSPGRSGTAFLISLLKGLPGLIALHEPEPKYQWQTDDLQKDPGLARSFVTGPKRAWIEALPEACYLEISHYLAKGFMEAWVEEAGIVPDAIILQRDPRKVASSWYLLNVDFTQNKPYIYRHMLHPEDRRTLFLPIKDWQTLNNYQLCYWYVLESQRRNEHYARYLEARGGKVFRITLEQISEGKELQALLEWLGMKPHKRMMEILRGRASERVNEKNQFKDHNRMKYLKEMDLDALEEEVRRRCGLSGQSAA